jgi:GNAT superfamily N-acetyltransferase
VTELTELHERDGAVVRAWLAAHVREHLEAWAATLGEVWDDAELEDHIARHRLVEREWADVKDAAAREPRGFVRVARVGGRPTGVSPSETSERPSRDLSLPLRRDESPARRGGERGSRQGDTPIGLLWAEERPDRFLCRPVAALCWVFVARAWRGRGVADQLMGAYEEWTARRPVVAREVYVTASNAPALRLYERRGFVASDHRLFAPALVQEVAT